MAWLYLVVGRDLRNRLAARPEEGLDGQGGRTAGGCCSPSSAMTASGALLLWAQRFIPMGTAYAVWTGIGAVGAFVAGILAVRRFRIGHAHRLDRA